MPEMIGRGHEAPASAVLVHICCGPCAIMPVVRLREEGRSVAGVFHNPNIHPLTEYLRRRRTALDTARRLGLPLVSPPARTWDLGAWLAAAHNPALVGDPLSADRCAWCYASRLDATAALAAGHGYAAFTTSLLYSPYQKHDLIVAAAKSASARHHVPFLYRDFRPDWREGVTRSRAWELYRQNYCACIYSEAERFAPDLEKTLKIEEDALEIGGQGPPDPTLTLAPKQDNAQTPDL
jgi:predicted adenine nucleotide alpha hydrolase (AANH) superfamily ATPase